MSEALSITINEGNQTLIAKKPFHFTVSVQPQDATIQGITWNSSNPEFATVDLSGNVTGHLDGITILTATVLDDPTIYSSVQVTIQTIPVSAIYINISQTSINIGETLQLEAQIVPTDATDQTLNWYCTNPVSASITPEGLVTGLSTGLAIVNVITPNNKIANAYIYVNIIPVISIILNKNTANMAVNDTLQLSATVAPANATNPEVTWFTSNQYIAAVDETGLVSAKNIGSVAITARAQNQTQTAYIFINPTNSQNTYIINDPSYVPVTGINIDNNSLAISIGQTVFLAVTITPESATHTYIYWSSSDETIASVDQTGIVTAISKGNAIINVTCDGHSSQAFITVTN